MQNKIDTAPTSTKYSPQMTVIEKKRDKNVPIDNQKEIINKVALMERRLKIIPEQVCSKGIHSCFNSVSRVKEMSKKYINETFRQPRISLSKRHPNDGEVSQQSFISNTDEPDQDGQSETNKFRFRANLIKKPLFYPDPTIERKESFVTIQRRNQQSQVNSKHERMKRDFNTLIASDKQVSV